MASRERLLVAMSRGKADHLPVQVQNWMQHYEVRIAAMRFDFATGVSTMTLQ